MIRDLVITEMGLEILFTCAFRVDPVKILEVIGDVLGGTMAAEEFVKALSTLKVTQ